MSEARKRFMQLLARGWTVAAARRSVGVSGTTAANWKNGYNLKLRDGTHRRVAGLSPSIARPISARFLSEDERVQIADLRRDGATVRAIAAELGRSPSTISRELRRNAGPSGRYGPFDAHRAAAVRRRRPRLTKLAASPELVEFVRERLRKRWSPAQISRALRSDHPDRADMRLSVETIYQAVYAHSSRLRVWHGRDKPPLRTGRDHRRAHSRLPAGHRRRRFAAPMLMIDDRPFKPEDRGEAGHWEGDFIVGVGHRSAIGTLVERQTRFVKLLHLDGIDSDALCDALLREFAGLPPHLKRSITWDQGTEMARHVDVRAATGAPVYFCHAGSPWQRGSNENTNGLLRQYFPKGTSLAGHTAKRLAEVAHELNERPRAVLSHVAPATLFNQLLPSDHTLALQ